MSDIFISYSKRDRAYAQELAALLQDIGYTVWWDTELVADSAFRETIYKQIEEAQVVIVIWSASAAKSDFVIDEADAGRRANKLVSLRLPGFKPDAIPLGFRNAHVEVLDQPDRIIAALQDRGANPKQPASLYALKAFAERLANLQPKKSGLKIAAIGLTGALVFLGAAFVATPGLTIDTAPFYYDEVNAEATFTEYARPAGSDGFEMDFYGVLHTIRHHKFLNYQIQKEPTKQTSIFYILDKKFNNISVVTINKVLYYNSINTHEKLPISLNDLETARNNGGYFYLCTSFYVEDQRHRFSRLVSFEYKNRDRDNKTEYFKTSAPSEAELETVRSNFPCSDDSSALKPSQQAPSIRL